MAKGRVYIFLGPEIGEKQDKLEEIRKSLRGSAQGLEETSFYAGETPVTDMVSILRNGSLFSDTRFFLIKNAEILKKKEDLELLASYLEAPQDDTTVILLSDAPGLDKRLEKTVPPGDKRIFWELFENRKTEWVASFFKRKGYRISSDGIAAILELVENNTDALRRECSNLMLFLGKDSVAEVEDVEKWLSHTREESAFTLFSRIAAGDLMRSIETLHTLLESKEPPQSIIAGLTWCFRKFRDYLTLVEGGSRVPDEFEFKKIGLGSTKVRKDYTALARRSAAPGRSSEDFADTCLSLIAEIDIRLRSAGTASGGILMDLLVYKLI